MGVDTEMLPGPPPAKKPRLEGPEGYEFCQLGDEMGAGSVPGRPVAEGVQEPGSPGSPGCVKELDEDMEVDTGQVIGRLAVA